MVPPPGPVKIGHKKDGHRRRPHRFHVSRPPLPYPAAGSTTVVIGGQLKSRLNMKDFTSFAPLDFLCKKWRGSNLRPLTNPNKYRQYS